MSGDPVGQVRAKPGHHGVNPGLEWDRLLSTKFAEAKHLL
jgi:hypothetical protein